MATIYEDAEKGTTENWTIQDNLPSGSSIKNIYDKSKNSKVIEFKGDGRRNSYKIGERKSTKGWNNNKEQVLQWKMNFSEKFKITVYTQTRKGLRVFHYTHKDYNKGLKQRYIKIGLGKESMSGTWQNISRNLASDLKTYEPDNQLLAINGIKIQGSGKIDDIELISQENETPCLTRQQLIDKINNDEDVTKVNTSCIKNMSGLFQNVTTTFNQKIGNWDVSNVTNMDKMFASPAPGGEAIFNQDISAWDTSNVTNMSHMFFLAKAFNQNIGKWNLSNVTNMERMLYRAESFNQNIEKWDTSNVNNMSQTLLGTSSLTNQNLSQWNVAKVNNHLQFLKESGENNIEPKWDTLSNEKREELLAIAKEHCFNKDNSTHNVLCSNEKGIVYVLTESKDDEQTTLYGSYQVSIDPNPQMVNVLNERTAPVWDHPKISEHFIKKLENTLIYGSISVSQEADPRGACTFFYKGKSVLSFYFVEDQGFLKNIHTLENGKKLSLEYTHTWAEENEGRYKEIYDISNPEKPKQISKIKIPLNEQF
jgi:surface protein